MRLALNGARARLGRSLARPRARPRRRSLANRTALPLAEEPSARTREGACSPRPEKLSESGLIADCRLPIVR